MKKILVIFTGGTIGSSLQNGWISPDKKTEYALLNPFLEKYSDVEFDTLEPYTILSENLSSEHLNILTGCISENISAYDGIIITHGTDTVQYSAAASSFCAGSDCNPIIFVSSNYPLNDSRANGYPNFEAAVEFIKNNCGKGVYIAYKNRNESVKFHSGMLALKHRESDDCIFSHGFNSYADYDGNNIKINHDYPLPHTPSLGKLSLIENPEILVIDSHPADSFNYSPEKFNAVIINPYHSGTLNTSNTDFSEFCSACKKRNIPVYCVNISEGFTYESSKFFDSLGIIPLINSTFCAAFIKIWIEISCKKAK